MSRLSLWERFLTRFVPVGRDPGSTLDDWDRSRRETHPDELVRRSARTAPSLTRE